MKYLTAENRKDYYFNVLSLRPFAFFPACCRQVCILCVLKTFETASFLSQTIKELQYFVLLKIKFIS